MRWVAAAVAKQKPCLVQKNRFGRPLTTRFSIRSVQNPGVRSTPRIINAKEATSPAAHISASVLNVSMFDEATTAFRDVRVSTAICRSRRET